VSIVFVMMAEARQDLYGTHQKMSALFVPKNKVICQTYNSRFFMPTSLVVDLPVPELSLSLL
jgi:hypothetical protein